MVTCVKMEITNKTKHLNGSIQHFYTDLNFNFRENCSFNARATQVFMRAHTRCLNLV